jgi:hypothetical protein
VDIAFFLWKSGEKTTNLGYECAGRVTALWEATAEELMSVAAMFQ